MDEITTAPTQRPELPEAARAWLEAQRKGANWRGDHAVQRHVEAVDRLEWQARALDELERAFGLQCCCDFTHADSGGALQECPEHGDGVTAYVLELQRLRAIEAAARTWTREVHRFGEPGADPFTAAANLYAALRLSVGGA